MQHNEQPGLRRLWTKTIEGLAIFAGIASSAWTFLYLLGKSFQYGEGTEVATLLIPVLALLPFFYFLRKGTRPVLRGLLIDFFVASLIGYLVMQFVVLNLI